jgi:hypothetical protein
MTPTMKAVDWTGHSWRERIFCCLALLAGQGFITEEERERIRRRIERKLNPRGSKR